MPLILPRKLPATSTLHNENIFTMTKARATTQDIRPLKILIVNLMPTKIATETQLARLLSNTSLQVELTLLCMGSHTSKNTSASHLASFYSTFDDIADQYFDGMILTGAPVETLPFEEVDYWNELCRIMDYSTTHVYSSMFICWGAMAALYHFYDIPKHECARKINGVFEHRLVRPKNPLVRGFDETFYMPHSRYTTIYEQDILAHPEIRVLAKIIGLGPSIMSTENGRRIFVLGHMEYDKETLRDEYERDLKRGIEVEFPCNYFAGDDPDGEIMFRWHAHACLFYSNWLNYYVYQETPYDLNELEAYREEQIGAQGPREDEGK